MSETAAGQVGRRTRAWRDAVIILVAAAVISLVAVRLDALDRAFQLAQRFDAAHVGEIVTVAAILLTGLVIFAARRTAELNRESHERGRLLVSLREAEERYRSLVENANDIVYTIEPGTERFVTLAGDVERILGYAADEVEGLSYDRVIHPDDRPRVRDMVRRKIEHGERTRYETRLLRKDGGGVWVEINSRLIKRSDGSSVIHGIARDISKRKTAESALRESEERFRLIFEDAPVGVYRTARDGRIELANPVLIRMLGYDSLRQLQQVDLDREGLPAGHWRGDLIREVERNDVVVGYESAWRRRDGTTMYVRENARAIRDDEGIITHFEGTVEDVTQQREDRERLRASEEQYRGLLENIQDGVFVIQDAKVVFANLAFAEMIGYSINELIGKTYGELVAPEDRELVAQRYRDRIAGGNPPRHYAFRMLHRDGVRRVMVEMSVSLVRYRGALASVGTLKDVTVQRQAEEALRASEENYRAIFDNANDAIFVHDPETGHILDVNRRAAEMHGYSVEEMLEIDVGAISFNEPPYTQEDALRRIRAAAKGEPQVFEWLGRRRDGSLCWQEVNLKRATIGGETRLLALVRDITERKRAEDAVEHSNRMLRLVLDTIPARVFWKDRELRYLGCNELFARDAGLDSPEDLLGKNDYVMGWVEQAERYRADDQLVIDTAEPMLEYEEPQSTPDGGLIWLRTSKVPLFDANGEVMGVLGTYQDITEWRRAQEELRESQRALSTLMSNLPGMVYRCRRDPDWTMEFVSEGAIDLTGYRPGQFIENRDVSYSTVIHPGDRDVVRQGVDDALERRESFRLIYRIRTRSGRTKWVWEQGRGVFDEDGRLWAIEGFIADITKQKRAEDALRESEEKYRMIVQNQTELVVKVDARGRFIYVSPSYCDVFGKTEQELLGSRFMPLVHPDDQEETMRAFKRCFRPPYTCQIEQRALTRHGWRWLAWADKAVLDDRGEVTAIVGVARDVTERKEAEQEIRRRMENEHLLRRELDHRVRNNLASLITLIDLAGQTAADAHSCAASMRDRAQTMAIMHALLSQTGGRPVTLDALIGALVPDGCLGTIKRTGPDVGVVAGQGQKLGMVINELMTNSVKYGALSSPDGVVDIDWELAEQASGDDRLIVTWDETGGPAIDQPPTPGVGTGLIEGLLKSDLRGQVELTYPRDGARHRLELTLEKPAMDVDRAERTLIRPGSG